MLDLREFREERGIQGKQVVEVLREHYPGYDKYLNSKIESPERYGCRLLNQAEQYLEDAFPTTAPVVRKRDTRKRTKITGARISPGKRERLEKKFRRDGFETVQAGIEHLIDKYLSE